MTPKTETGRLPITFPETVEHQKYADSMQISKSEEAATCPVEPGAAGPPPPRQIDIIDKKPETLPPDLSELSKLWGRLPDAVKAGFLATARALAVEVRS